MIIEPAEINRITRELARNFVERSEALGLQGKKRDDAALDYVCGAATAYQIIHEDALVRHLSTVAALVVSVRGYFGIRQILEQGNHVPD